MKQSTKKKLSKTYFDVQSEGGYGGVERLHKSTGVKRKNVKKWAEGEEAYTLHKPIRYKFERRPTIVSGPYDQFQMDLLDTSAYSSKNNGVRFLLIVIDVFTKFAWAVGLKNKSANSVIKGLENILKSKSAKKVKSIQTDKGTEFINKKLKTYLKKKKIRFFTSENEDIKCSIVERFNRTLQSKLHRYLTRNHTSKYINVLPKIIKGYNNSVHKTTGHTPQALVDHVLRGRAIPGNKSLEDIWQKIYQLPDSYWKPTVRASVYLKKKKKGVSIKSKKQFLSVGDFVRINKTRKVFKKGYLPSWSKELFTVSKIRNTNPTTFQLTDASGEIIKGGFYYQELQRVTPPEFYDIEEVIKTRKSKRGREFLVKWVGYSPSYNSWVSEQNLLKFK